MPIEERISIFFDSLPYWQAFWRLNSSRNQGMNGPMPIQLSEIKAYCDIFTVFDIPRFVDIIYLLDREYLDYLYKAEEDKETGKSKKKKKKAAAARSL